MRELRKQLNSIYELENAKFQNGTSLKETIDLEIRDNLNAIKNPSIRAIVRELPAHYQTKDGIAFFDTLTELEARSVASYLSLEFRQITTDLDKNTLLTDTIPDAFKAYNESVLRQFEATVTPAEYDKLTELSAQIRPEIFTEQNVRAWGINITALQVPVFGEILMDAMNVEALLNKNPGQNFTLVQIQHMVELAQRIKLAYMENDAEMSQLPVTVLDYLIKFEDQLHKVRAEPKDFRAMKERFQDITLAQDEESTFKLNG